MRRLRLGELMKHIVAPLLLIGFCWPTLGADKTLKTHCPMTIIAGEAIGPIKVGSDLQSVLSDFPLGKKSSLEGGLVFFEQEGLHASFCNGKAHEVWVEFGPVGGEFHQNCLTYKKKK